MEVDMNDPAWVFYMHPSRINQRVNNAASSLYPYGSNSWNNWADYAVREYQERGTTPESLKDQRSPRKNSTSL